MRVYGDLVGFHQQKMMIEGWFHGIFMGFNGSDRLIMITKFYYNVKWTAGLTNGIITNEYSWGKTKATNMSLGSPIWQCS